MSTKIYNGFRVNAGNAQANLDLLATIKEPIQSLVNQKMASVFGGQVADMVDRFCILRHMVSTGEESSMPSEWAALRTKMVGDTVRKSLLDAQSECRSSLERDAQVDCDVGLFIRAVPGSGMLLGRLSEECVGVYEFLLGTPGIEEFGYWDNTDRPNSLSEKEWSNRERFWSEAESAARLCMTWTPSVLPLYLSSGFNPPSHNERVQSCAKLRMEALAIERHLQALEAQGEEAPRAVSWAHNIIMQAKKDMEDGPLAEEFEKLKALYFKILPRDLSACLDSAFDNLR